MDWTTKRCVPCEGGVARLDPDSARTAASWLDGWELRDDATRLHKRLRHADFLAAMRFVDAMARVAEAEGHHPDFCVHYATVDVTIWTHAAGGLTQNDFILAAKLDALPEARGAAAGAPSSAG